MDIRTLHEPLFGIKIILFSESKDESMKPMSKKALRGDCIFILMQ